MPRIPTNCQGGACQANREARVAELRARQAAHWAEAKRRDDVGRMLRGLRGEVLEQLLDLYPPGPPVDHWHRQLLVAFAGERIEHAAAECPPESPLWPVLKVLAAEYGPPVERDFQAAD